MLKELIRHASENIVASPATESVERLPTHLFSFRLDGVAAYFKSAEERQNFITAIISMGVEVARSRQAG